MALLRNEIQRSFTFKKGTEMITLPDPNPNDSPESVMSLLLEHLSGTDNSNRTRPDHQG